MLSWWNLKSRQLCKPSDGPYSDDGLSPTLYEAEGIPDLIVEVTSLLAKALVEEDVVARWSTEHHTHTNTVGTKLVNQNQWVW